VQLAQIRERVQTLLAEIAELRAANEKYLSKHLHSSLEIHAQRQRELRLQQIVDELALLTKRKF
jgi:2-phospho-L-lactate transferase/gluconeogenesis factor (CofD/UPF0052 family)